MKTLIKLGASILALSVPMGTVLAQEAAPSAAAAEPKVSLQSDVMAIVTTTDEAGQQTTQLTEPTEYTPGTKLSFGMNYTNGGTVPATNVTGTNPLNEAVRLSSDADPALMVSVDGGTTFGTLDTLSVAIESGGMRAATHSDVTHVRWTIASIAPGESGRISFPVIIR
ncbi:MAG: hypothetical protein AAF251_02870 [Pseudomonadota bacterium]